MESYLWHNQAGIDPAHQAVILSIGSFSLLIPTGSFEAEHDNAASCSVQVIRL
jgi:hypothetical protein